MTFQEALDRAEKYREPTPEDLGLPNDTDALYRLEYSLEAPRAAWRAYYAAVGYFSDEANARQRVRDVRAKARKQNRIFPKADLGGDGHIGNRGAADPRKARGRTSSDPALKTKESVVKR